MRKDAKNFFMVQKEPLFLVLCLAAAACIVEFEACLALISPPDYRAALLIHIFTVTLLALWTLFLSAQNDFRFSLLLLLATSVIGPFGAAIALLAIIVYALSKASSSDPSEWMEQFFSSQETSESDWLQERLASSLNQSASVNCIEPYQDILANGTILQKQITITKITRYFRSQFAPLLLQAARNPEPAVRVQAATALAKIERDFMAQQMRMQNELKDIPDNRKRQTELAHLYDDYAYAGLTDDENRHSLRNKAIHIYESHLAHNSDQSMLIRLARLYLRQGEAEKSSKLLYPIVESDDAMPEAASWYMEALFIQRRLKELRQFADSYAAKHEKQTEHHPFQRLREMFQVWAEGGNTLGFDWKK